MEKVNIGNRIWSKSKDKNNNEFFYFPDDEQTFKNLVVENNGFYLNIYNELNVKVQRKEVNSRDKEWNSPVFNYLKTMQENGIKLYNLYKNHKFYAVPKNYVSILNEIEQSNLRTSENNNENSKEHAHMNIPLNQIFYGPPGTGKTYNTVVKAMEILDNELYLEYEKLELSEKQVFYKNKLEPEFNRIKNEEKRIEFVTFHQSYSYEEFVEGIKPDLEQNELKYTLEDGIFKKICKQAKRIASKRTPIDFSRTKVFKISLDDTMYDYCIRNNVVSLENEDKNFSDKNSDTGMKKGDIILVPHGDTDFRAIARVTGNYFPDTDRIKNSSYTHFRNVEWLYNGADISFYRISPKGFSHSSPIHCYAEIDFKGTDKYNLRLDTEELNEIIAEQINKKISKDYVLIIDEINRGDVSKIFGELITLIEEDKRIGKAHKLEVKLPYSKEPFGVPNNVYIIGTMNTADRSIALLDTALRRRFDFEEMMPNPELLAGKVVENINLQTLLEKINQRITAKYDRDHQIGHSYFMGIENKEDLERAYKNRILPLLNEYFYNEIKTVAEILNCTEAELTGLNCLEILTKAAKNDSRQE